MNRRSDREVMDLIMGVALKDDRIRGVLLCGSRVMPDAPKDKYRDFDVVYLVDDICSFTNDPDWIEVFGELLILQCPEDWYSHPYDYEGKGRYAYLMQFADGTRIDLTLEDRSHWDSAIANPEPRRVLLKKEDIPIFDIPGKGYYHLEKPEEKEFLDTCNEFWWLSVYVAKALCREELTLAKKMLDDAQYSMFYKMLCWKVGREQGFSVSVGKEGKYLKRFLSPEDWEQFVSLFAGGDYGKLWRSLFGRCEWFHEMAKDSAACWGYGYWEEEARQVYSFLKEMKNEQ